MNRVKVFGMRTGHGPTRDVFFFPADPNDTSVPLHNKIIASDLRAPVSRWCGTWHVTIKGVACQIVWVDTKWRRL